MGVLCEPDLALRTKQGNAVSVSGTKLPILARRKNRYKGRVTRDRGDLSVAFIISRGRSPLIPSLLVTRDSTLVVIPADPAGA